MTNENPETILVILYFYCNRGLALLNSFHSLGLLIFGAYFALHLTNPLWFAGMTIPGIGILISAGWYAVNRIDRPSEKLAVSRGTHYQMSQYDMIREQRDILQKILVLLEKHE